MSYAYSMEVNQAESTPMTDPYRALCAELVDIITAHANPDDAAVGYVAGILTRARALLAEPVIPVKQRIFPTPSQAAECGGPCYEGSYCPEACDCGLYQPPHSGYRRRAGGSAMTPAAAPVPEPGDEALANFTAWFCRNYPGPDTLIHRPEWHAPKVFRAAADALARWGRPAAAPVPVSERLPQLEDLAADAVSGLRYIEQTHGRLYGVGWDRVYEKADRLQPAHALPTPEGG